MAWSGRPAVLEINTWVWLTELTVRHERHVDLASVPAEAWDEACIPGIDAVWLMGVWERSEVGVAIGRSEPGFVAAHRAVLPDLDDADVVGSPYCVRRYVVDGRLGGDAGLAAARAELARRGCALVVDYVPNHVAPDHPWVHERPDVFIAGDEADLARQPDAFIGVGDAVIARGRDPYFPPWSDVVQLDATSESMRAAAVETLRSIADRADAVRCDMAMLMMNDVFATTWGRRARATPSVEFWPEVIGELRTTHPSVTLLAEAYWDLEEALMRQGFDACYDKRLYDRLVGADAAGVRWHLGADPSYQHRLVRFIENHDEPRAAHELPGGADRAAAIAVATLPGITLWHEGQFDGRRTRLPVLLGRRPDEPPDPERRRFYERLVAAAPGIRRGAWMPAPAWGWEGDDSHENLVAWTWTSPAARSLIVVNLSPATARARVQVPWTGSAPVRFEDPLTGDRFDRHLDELARFGLYVELGPWGAHVLQVGS